jgi:hypothetical protein
MKIVCSWCKKVIGEKAPYRDKSVTHAKCAKGLKKQVEAHGEKVNR